MSIVGWAVGHSATFAFACFSIIILVSTASTCGFAIWITSARASFHVPVLVAVAGVTLRVAVAFTVLNIPFETVFTQAG